MSDSKDFTVTYTEAPPYPDYVPGPEHPPSPAYVPEFVPELVYPKFMPPEDNSDPNEDPEEDDEDPEEGLADYPTDRDDVDKDEEEESSRDEPDDEEEDEDEDEEEHLASANFVPPHVHRVTTRMLRAKEPSTSHPLPLSTLPSSTPPSGTPALLPIPLPTSSPPLLLPFTSHRVDVLEVTLPPWKRLCIAFGMRFKVSKSSSAPTASPTGGFRTNYRFVGTLDDKIRRDPKRERKDGNSQQEEIDIVTKTNDVLPLSDENDDDLSLLEEADLFLVSDNSIPPGIENVADDPEEDIHFLEDLLIDDSILSHESFDSNFVDNPLIPRRPPEPPDVETDTGEEISVVMNDKDEDVYSSFILIIYPEMFPLLLSAESEDTIFDPGIFE
nr:hypothetical protein [Tanacetum cinerariifolium]